MGKQNIEKIKIIFQEIEGRYKDIFCEEDEPAMVNQLLNYQLILLREDNFLNKFHTFAGLAKDHPLRCALALQACVKEFYKMRNEEEHCFVEKLTDFRTIASHSKFYPNLRVAGLLLATSLLIFGTLTLGILALSAPPAFAFTVAAFATIMGSSCYGLLIGKFFTSHYHPIYNSEAQANTFFPSYPSAKRSTTILESIPRCC